MDEMTVAWIAAIVGSFIGLGTLVHFSWIAGSWPRAAGRVVDNIAEYSHSSSGQSVVYFPKIEFSAAGGSIHVVKGDVGHRKPTPIGHPIQLWYKPSNPNHAMTMKWPVRLMFSGFFILASLLCWLKIAGVIDG